LWLMVDTLILADVLLDLVVYYLGC